MPLGSCCRLFGVLQERHPRFAEHYSEIVQELIKPINRKPDFHTAKATCDKGELVFSTTIPGTSFLVMSDMISSMVAKESRLINVEGRRVHFGIVPAYFFNLNLLTSVRLWNKSALRFEGRGDRLNRAWKLAGVGEAPHKWHSLNFILLHRDSVRKVKPIRYAELLRCFDLHYWSYPSEGYSCAPQLRITRREVAAGARGHQKFELRALTKHWKSLFILNGLGSSFREGPTGRSRQKFETVQLKGLTHSEGELVLVDCDYRFETDQLVKTRSVAVMGSVARWLKDRKVLYPSFICGVVTEEYRNVPRIKYLTFAKGIQTYSQLMAYCTGMAIDCEYRSSKSLACVGSLSRILAQVKHIFSKLSAESDITMNCSGDDWTELLSAIETMKPMVYADDMQDVWYLHPFVYGILVKEGLVHKIENREWTIALLRAIDNLDEFDLTDFTNPLFDESMGTQRLRPILRNAENGIIFSKNLRKYF